MKDSIMISLLAGFIGTTLMDLSDALLWRTKKTEMLTGHLAGSMIMRGFRTNRAKNFVLGEILHMITGAALGIPVFQLFKRTGTDNHLIKGAFAGMLSWGILYNFGQRTKLFSSKPHFTKSHFSALWNNLLYGVTTAQAIVSLSDPSLFPEQNQSAHTQATFNTTNQMPHARPDMPGQNIVDESSNVVLQ